MGERISTGSKIVNDFLAGGYERDIITTIYGPSSSGKTNLALLAALNTAKDKKVLYIDTEGVSLERITQLTPDYKKLLENVIFIKPTSFNEQKEAFKKLKKIIDDKFGLIVIDTIAMFYRIELSNNVHEINRELGQQLSYLAEIARKKKIPVLVTNQVYADFENKERVNIVGGDLLKYSSKCLIELQKGHKGKRIAILRKHRSLPEGKVVKFVITGSGVERAD